MGSFFGIIEFYECINRAVHFFFQSGKETQRFFHKAARWIKRVRKCTLYRITRGSIVLVKIRDRVIFSASQRTLIYPVRLARLSWLDSFFSIHWEFFFIVLHDENIWIIKMVLIKIHGYLFKHSGEKIEYKKRPGDRKRGRVSAFQSTYEYWSRNLWK